VESRSCWITVRERTTAELHKLAQRFQRQRWDALQDLTEGQERMWDQIMAELVWRSARKRRGYVQCSCEYCFSQVDWPFDWSGPEA